MTTADIARAGAEPSPFERKVIAVCTMLGTLMMALDTTIANVALPHMQGSLSAGRDQVTWVLTSYIVAAAVMTAPVGWFAARFGRKNLFLISLIGFTIASVLCGVAQNLPEMVLFRVLQGAFGAALMPVSQSIMLDLYPIEQRGSAMAFWGVGVMVGPILGPTLGGYLTDLYDWRWVFFINVPFGIIAITGIVLAYREGPKDAALRFDWTGFLVLSLGIGALQLMLDRGTSKDWWDSAEIVVEAGLAILGLYLFTVHVLMAKKPLIPPRIFLDSAYTYGFILMFVTGFLMLASTALLPPYFQNLGNYSVLQTGLLLAPRGLGTMIAMVFVGRLLNRIDARIPLALALAAMSATMYDMSTWTPDIGEWHVVTTTVIQGIAIGCVFVPVQTISFATLDPALRTDGTALFSLIRNIGSAVGVSLSTAILGSSVQTLHAQLAEHATPFNRMLTEGQAGMMWNPLMPYGLTALDAEINRQALITAYANDFLFIFYVSLPAIVLPFLMKRPPRFPTASPRQAPAE